MINGQSISSGEKHTLTSNEKSTCKLTTTIGQLSVKTPLRLKNCADEL